MNTLTHFRVSSYKILFGTLIIIVASMFYFATAFAAGATYYVSSSTGSDTNTGTSTSTPWKTLSKVNSAMATIATGDTILLNRGDIFEGSLTVTKSGVSFGAYGSGSNPTISGFVSPSTWTSVGTNLWESNALPTGTTVEMMTVNGARQGQGRYPNTGWLTMESDGGANKFTDNQLTGNWVGAEVATRKANWVFDKGKVTSQSGGTITYSNISPDGHTPGWGYFIKNGVGTLDLQGEWAYNSSTKKITMYSGSMPSGVRVSSVGTLVSINNVSNTTFSNIAFEGSNDFSFYIDNAPGTVIQNGSINFSGSFGIKASNSSGMRVEGNEMNTTYNTAFLLAATDNIIIRNNNISNTGFFDGMGNGLNVTSLEYTGISMSGSSGALIEGNRVINTGYVPIIFMFGSNNTIRNNFIDTFDTVKDDGGGIYTWNEGRPDNVNNKIQNNIILNAKGAMASRNDPWYTPANGIYMDDNTANVEISGNTIAFTAGSGLFLHNSRNLNIFNNTVYDSGNSTGDPASVGQFQVLSNAGTSYLTRNLQVNGNKFIAKQANQWVLKWDTGQNDIPQFGTADNNYYTRPIDDNLMARPCTSSCPEYNLAQWKTYSGKDLNSKKSPKSITTTNDLRFEYNDTASSKTISLDANYIDVTGASYNGSIILAPYSSAVLIKNGTATTPTNTPPTANAGIDQTIILPTSSVTLAGVGSDAQGTVTYSWSQISGTNATITNSNSASTNITGLSQGISIFRLTVTDIGGLTATDDVIVTVNGLVPLPVNSIPIVTAGIDQTITLPTNSITLSGSASDADGTIVAYDWGIVSGADATIADPSSPVTTVTGLMQGTYTFWLTVTDDMGATNADAVMVTVNGSIITPPAAGWTFCANEYELCNFTGTKEVQYGLGSTFVSQVLSGPVDCSNTIFGDPVPGATKMCNYKDTAPIVVVNNPPVVSAGTDKTITLPTSSITLTGSATDSDGIISNYTWSKVSGGAATISSPSTVSTSIKGLVAGTYTFRLTVKDNGGLTASDDMILTVKSAPVVIVVKDTIPPVVSITSPMSNATVTGRIIIRATAADNRKVSKVQFYRGSTLIGTDTSSPYTMTWSTSKLAKTTYILTAKAYDAAGNVGISNNVQVIVK